LLNRSELFFSKLLHLSGVDDLRGKGGVNATGLDGDHEVSSVLNKHGGVESKNTGLIGLGDISENHVDHRHEHSVFLRVSSILDNWDHVSTLLSHVDKITADSLGEFDSVDSALGSDQVGNVGAGSTGSTTKVKDLAARFDENVTDTTDDGCGNL
jgi:hypothetical protein